MSEDIAQFLNRVAADPVLRMALSQNRQQVLSGSGLSARARHWLKQATREGINDALELIYAARLAQEEPVTRKTQAKKESARKTPARLKPQPQHDVPQHDVPKRKPTSQQVTQKRSAHIDVPQHDVPKRKPTPQRVTQKRSAHIDVPQHDVPKRKRPQTAAAQAA